MKRRLQKKAWAYAAKSDDPITFLAAVEAWDKLWLWQKITHLRALKKQEPQS